MAEKTEAQIEAEKNSVAAMKNAQSNMRSALERIATLEAILKSSDGVLYLLKRHTGSESRIMVGSNSQTVHMWIDEMRNGIAKVL